MQGNGELVFCKTQAFSSSNVKMDNLLEMLVGVTRTFLIYIYKFYLYKYSYLSASIFFSYLQMVFLLHSEMRIQSLCIPDG